MLLKMERYKVGGVAVDVSSVVVDTPTGGVELYPKTHALLVELIRAAPEICSTQDLLDRVWSGEFVGDQNLKQRIYQLREKLGPFDVKIDTVRGVGYRLATAVNPLRTSKRTPTQRDPQAVEDMSRATEMVDAMEHGKAVVLLQSVLEREPRWLKPRTLLAWSLMWIGRQAEARQELRTVLDLSERNGGDERLLAGATFASFSGDAVTATERFELARIALPEDYWIAVNLTGLYWLLGRDDAARELVDELELIRPGFYLNAWQRAFHELLSVGDMVAAERHFAEALRRNPHIPLPIAALAPALTRWTERNLEEALTMMDDLVFARFDEMPPVGKDQALTFRSRLLADMQDVDGSYSDQRRAAALHESSSPWRWHHDLELGLFVLDSSPAKGTEILEGLTSTPSSLYRVQAHGWLGVHAARHGDDESARSHLAALTEVAFDDGWEWGYPARPGFDRAQSVFPMLIGAHLAMRRGNLTGALRSFARAQRAAPTRLAVVPVVSIDGRANLEATEGVALAAAAQGNTTVAHTADLWFTEHPLECAVLTQAGARYGHRASDRLRQSAGISSATPIEKSNALTFPE
jgi:DNA-binding winged helix-turn-helix (wHTH) protein